MTNLYQPVIDAIIGHCELGAEDRAQLTKEITHIFEKTRAGEFPPHDMIPTLAVREFSNYFIPPPFNARFRIALETYITEVKGLPK